jgi:hypothetical protein
VEKCGTARQATDDIIWCMHIACWIPKAADTHSECVILIALPLQQWLHTFIASHVKRWIPTKQVRCLASLAKLSVTYKILKHCFTCCRCGHISQSWDNFTHPSGCIRCIWPSSKDDLKQGTDEFNNVLHSIWVSYNLPQGQLSQSVRLVGILPGLRSNLRRQVPWSMYHQL